MIFPAPFRPPLRTSSPPRPLKAVPLAEVPAWFEPKRFSPLQMVFAYNRFKYRWNGLHQSATGSLRAHRLLVFVPPYFLYCQMTLAAAGERDMYKVAKYHW